MVQVPKWKMEGKNTNVLDQELSRVLAEASSQDLADVFLLHEITSVEQVLTLSDKQWADLGITKIGVISRIKSKCKHETSGLDIITKYQQHKKARGSSGSFMVGTKCHHSVKLSLKLHVGWKMETSSTLGQIYRQVA